MKSSILIPFILFFVMIHAAFPYSIDPENESAVHQRITKEAIKIWLHQPYEII